MKDIAQQISKIYPHTPDVAVILGSGWGEVVSVVSNSVTIPYKDLKGMPSTTVKGHAGNFVLGELGGKRVILMQGRFHLYEGKAAWEAVLPIDIFYQLGVKTLVVTNASGGINAGFSTGDVMIITDHINLTGTSPLIGRGLRLPNQSIFTDMTQPYNPEYSKLLGEICKKSNIPCHTGCYLQVLGPAYETKAEVAAYATLGADAVGMSTALEVIKARYLGMQCAGISLISNMAAGLNNRALNHGDVLAVTTQNSDKLKGLLTEFIMQLPL